jgi:hypothetical protein
MTEYCNQCAEKLDDGDTVARDHDGAYYHYDCWLDGGPPHKLKPHLYQEDDMPNPSTADPVNHPTHYTSHPSGIECIQVTEHMGFNLGNALKYIWRCDLKKDATEDLKKAIWYIEREIQKRGKA